MLKRMVNVVLTGCLVSMGLNTYASSGYFSANSGLVISCKGGYTITLIDDYYETAEIKHYQHVFPAFYTPSIGARFTAYKANGDDLFSIEFPDYNLDQAILINLQKNTTKPIKCQIQKN